MSSSPALEPSSPPTTPSSPALRATEYQAFHTSTPNYVSKQKQNNPPLNVVLPSSAALASPPTYGEPTLTPPPRSPGIPSPATPASGDVRNHPPDGTSSDKSSETAVGVSRTPSTALSRKESYKAQRQHYRREKKRVASALLHSIEDPSVVVLADWLKVRGSLKSWTKLWCVLKPGLLLLYKSSKAKSSHWVGTVLLTSCQVIERPSKKDGFCFKLYHPLEQSIWAPRGPHNETIGAVVQPLPTAHLIFRAPSPAAGHCWLDGMELALRCSNAMLRCSRSRPEETAAQFAPVTDNISHEELEKHFNEHVLKLSETPSTYTPLMSVSDYSPRNPEKKEKKSKWAQLMESLEHMSKEQETTDSQTPEKDNIFTFIKEKRLMQNLGRSSPSASSAKVVVEPKVSNRLSKSLASSPLRTELTKHPILKCFELPKLSIIDKKDKLISPAVIEENLMKLMMVLPKRRSSTPSTKLTQKSISNLRKSGAKTDSENDEVFSKMRGSEVICNKTENIIITKTSPSIERFLRYSSTSTDDPWECGRKSPYAEHYDTQKYSLIDYHKLPSVSYESCKTERRDERFNSQNVYVAGKIVCHELAGAASDTDSEGSRGMAGMPEGADPARGRLDPAERVAALYTEDQDDHTGAAGELVEEVAEENKSILWFLLRQVRPGMDLSKVVLPTFILEPRSFLDKLSDNYFHADILSQAKTMEDPYHRFKLVLRWYLSGLYRKPRGLKKPYNPVLGEIFRCCWLHPDMTTYTYYVAEQVSHHPPVSAFYVSNRKEGFVIEGSLLSRSKFYGNSLSAILEGCARVHLLEWNETYVTTAPYAHCKGIVIGTLSMELGGKVHIVCNETGYSADIEFKLRSFLGGADQTNAISGRIKKGKDTVATVDGYWDGRIDIRDKGTGEESNLVDVAVLKQNRLKRYLMKMEHQEEFESQRLWAKVSEAIHDDNQIKATEEKTVIEEGQRERARNTLSPWVSRLFQQDRSPAVPDGVVDQGWKYKHANIRPWQPKELLEYEEDFIITTTTQTGDGARGPAGQLPSRVADARRRPSDSDSRDDGPARSKTNTRTLKQTLFALDNSLREQSQTLERLTSAVETLSAASRRPQQLARVPTTSYNWDLFAGFALAMVLQSLLNWLFNK